jgi:3-methyladenine DNA glycosylase AlkD
VPGLTAAADALEAELRGVGHPERAEHERAYLRSDLIFLGASVPQIRAAAKRLHADHPDLGHDGLVALVEDLWRRGIHECRMAAVELLDLYADRLEPDDVDLVERLIRESGTWALVDGLAATVAGGLIERHPPCAERLDRWAADDSFWVRRAALLALLVPLRRGEGDFERFTRYADAMLEEGEFFIRKAIGWVLREVGKTRPELVSAWLAPRVQRVSRLTIREATKYLPAEQRDALVAAVPRNRRSQP